MDFDHHAPPLLNSTYFHQQKSMDEMKQFVMSMELQETRLRAEQDLKSRDAQILRLKELLATAIKERDEAQDNCKKILLEKILLHQSAPNSAVSSIEDDPTRGIDSTNRFSSSDCDESIASSPQRMPPPPAAEFPVVIKGPLPEKGKLLQAVVKAGPLLQTLLLAGPLPQWRHPPPAMDPYQIPPPPVVVPSSPFPALPPHIGNFSDWAGGKQGPPEVYNWSNESKRRKTDLSIK